MNPTSLKMLLSILVIVLFIGCGKKEADTPPVPASAREAGSIPFTATTNPAATASSQTNAVAPGYFLFVSMNAERLELKDSTTEVPSLRTHRAILYCTDLPVNQPFEVSWRLTDPNGKEWALSDSKYVTTPTSPSWSAWCTYYAPETPPKAGVWKWEVSILDGPTRRREFTMMPPSADEMAQLARYEKARESVFRAFSQRWIGHEGYYFCTLTNGIMQISGLSYRSKTDYVSAADVMNGISYKGRFSFTFRTYRMYDQNQRWTDWEDSVEYRSTFSEFMGEAFAGGLPYYFREGYDMNFTIQERDGHWRVWSDSKAAFVNSRLVSNYRRGHPSEPEVMDALHGASSRKDALGEGESARSSINATGADKIKTMDMLRGRPL